MAEVVVFSLLYFVVSLCFVFRTAEFVSFGITVDNIFDKILGSEGDQFIYYHIRKTSLTLLVHSFLPFGYLIGISAAGGSISDNPFPVGEFWWRAFRIFSVVYPFLTMCFVLFWSSNNWSNHPLAKNLLLFTSGNQWRTLANDINAEYKRLDKIVLRPSSLVKVVATDNWLLRVSQYSVQVAHQSDCALIATSADTHEAPADSPSTIQYVNIEVKSTRPFVKPFYIRCKALELQDLQEKIRHPIVVLDGVKFHKSTLDQFLEVFNETISQNPRFIPPNPSELEACAGCMVAQPNVKLVKHCDREECVNCYCRPMWCANCMGTWFASRQEENAPETWLSSQCTCPMCRSIFCILDVSLLETNNDTVLTT